MEFFLIAAGSVLLGLIILVVLLLSVKVGFYAETCYTKKEGFSFLGKVTWLFFEKQIFPKEKGKDKEKQDVKPDKKTDADIVKIIKYITAIAKELVWVPRKVLIFRKQCVWCKVALDDPMKNGLVYAAVSSALIGATQVIVCRFKTDEYKVRVTPDFTAKDGISIKDITWLQLRPLVLIICLIYAYTKSPKLRKAVKGLLKEIKNTKGSNKK